MSEKLKRNQKILRYGYVGTIYQLPLSLTWIICVGMGFLLLCLPMLEIMGYGLTLIKIFQLPEILRLLFISLTVIIFLYSSFFGSLIIANGTVEAICRIIGNTRLVQSDHDVIIDDEDPDVSFDVFTLLAPPPIILNSFGKKPPYHHNNVTSISNR